MLTLQAIGFEPLPFSGHDEDARGYMHWFMGIAIVRAMNDESASTYQV